MSDTKILSSKTILQSKYFTVTHKDIERNGKQFSKDFIERSPNVLIIPYTAKNEIYLESQYRDAMGKNILELVSGNMETGDNPLEAAKRELLEETGLTAKSWKKLHQWDLSANMIAKIHLFAVTDLDIGEQQLDDDEQITVVKLPIEAVIEKIEKGEMTKVADVAAVLLFVRMRKEGKL